MVCNKQKGTVGTIDRVAITPSHSSAGFIPLAVDGTFIIEEEIVDVDETVIADKLMHPLEYPAPVLA